MLKTYEKIEALINDLKEDVSLDIKYSEYVNRVYLIGKYTIGISLSEHYLIRKRMYIYSDLYNDVVYDTDENKLFEEIEKDIRDMIGKE